MALLNFPTPTFNGQLYPVTPLPGQSQYQWSEANQTWVLLGKATGVIPGTYGNSTNVGQFTVDAQGNIVTAQNVPISSLSGGTVTSVGTGTGLTGGPFTTSGTISLLPATSSVIGGVYPDGTTLDVNGSGELSVINAGGGTLQQVTTNGTTTTDVITVGGLTSNGDMLPGSHEVYDLGSPTAAWRTLYCKNTSIYLGPYKLSVVGGVLEVDSTPVSPGGTVTSIVAGTGLSGGTITSSGTIDLADTAVTSGSYTYASITVDAQGRLTAASDGTAPVTSVSGSSPISVTTGTTPTVSIASASITQAGAVQLNDTVTSTLTTEAATANAVRTAYDLAAAAMPVTGGNFTGDVTFDTGTTLTVDTGATLTLNGTTTFNSQPTFATGVDIGPAVKVTYGNTTSGLTAIEVQGAIDEIVSVGGCCVGTVTCVDTGTGLSGGAVTTTGTISLKDASVAEIGGVKGFTYDAGTALGVGALYSAMGTDNVAIGCGAMQNATVNSVENTAIGSGAFFEAKGRCNVAIGYLSLSNTTSACSNIAIGNGSAANLSSGCGNIGIGYQALLCLTTGRNNTEIGANNWTTQAYSPPFQITTECNRLVLGSTATSNAYVQVAWTVVSDERDKTEIQPIALGLDFVSQLEPISFRFKESRESDQAVGPTRYGFTAQDVLAAEGDNPVIVDTEDSNKLKITDSHLIPVLVQAIKELRAEMESLRARLS